MCYNRTYEPEYNFCATFYILLYTHIVQFGINFDSHIENHLTYIKE